MRFADCEMRPGKVLEVVDNYGTIKASCVGIFSEEDDVANMPPIHQLPFIKSSRHYFAAPHVDDLIWVIFNETNPQELFYCFRDDTSDNSSKLDTGAKDVEILMKRTDPDDRTKVIFENTYDSDDGYMVSNGGDKASKFNIDNKDDHDMHLEHSSGVGVHISKDAISLGSEGKSSYKAPLGEPVADALKAIVDCLEQVMNACTMPHTAPIKPVIAALLPTLKTKIAETKILSDKVTLDK